MKKVVILICAVALGMSPCLASDSEATSATSTSVVSSIQVPTGAFFNGSNFVYVQSGWVRIVINGQSREYDYSAQMDPNDNYVLKLENGEAITIYPNGRTLYYNGTTYSKK